MASSELIGWLLIAAGVLGLALLAGVVYYKRKIARMFRQDPDFARAWEIRERTQTSYRRRR